MNNDINELYEKFCLIEKQKWIKSEKRGPAGIGYTFEKLLLKPEENFPIPDFKSIEIKTHRNNSKKNIHLFNATPDGDYLYSIKRILDKLGYPDKNNSLYKVFNMSFNTKEYTKIGFYKKAKIIIDKDEKKLKLIAIDNNGKNLNVDVSWSFQLLNERLLLKLKKLALIKANSKIFKYQEYFHYNNIKFYKLKNFDTFLSLIEKGTIIVTFKISVFKSGKRKGQIHDHGTDFSISERDICKLYDEIKL